MPLALHLSNNLLKLKELLADKLRGTSKNIFLQDIIITQTEGMNHWLCLELAQEAGIFANFKFQKPNNFINDVFRMAGLGYEKSFASHQARWALYFILGEPEFKQHFPKIAEYFTFKSTNREGEESLKDDTFKRMQLAIKMADLFDQYLLYREAMIRVWGQGKSWEEHLKSEIRTDLNAKDKLEKWNKSDAPLHEPWQRWLWNRLTKTLGEKYQDKVSVKDRLNSLVEPLVKAVKNRDTEALNDLVMTDGPLSKFWVATSEKIPQIHLFGLSTLTSYHLDILYKLSHFIDVNFYLLNPAPEQYWYDSISRKQLSKLRVYGGMSADEYDSKEGSLGNPLLMGWGGLGKNTFSLLFDPRYDDYFQNQLDNSASEQPNPSTLLGAIQNDVFNNWVTDEDRNPMDSAMLTDESIAINSCYTPLREVEVLCDYLTDLMEKAEGSLEAKDILVMVSDIETYAPYVSSVFDNAPFKIPYSIADRGFVQGDTLIATLSNLLDLNEDEFTSEKVLNLLDSKLVRSRFKITDLSLVRKALTKANIRFGIAGKKRDDTRYVSWKRGIERIVLGIAMSGGEEYVLEEGDSTYPLDDFEGSEAKELLCFVHFAQELIHMIEGRRQEQTLPEWASFVEEVQRIFIDDMLCEDQEILALQEQLSLFNQSKEEVPRVLTELVPYEVFATTLRDNLFAEAQQGGYINGRVTFCSTIPMRSIPFKVVAMLGMGNGKFPRKDTNQSFDLMHLARERGDRNTKDNDKYLFLEAMMSAKEHFYLSYIGREAKSNKELEPSILIDELFDYIQEGIREEQVSVKDALLVEHPLHGFSKQYLKGEEKLFTYFDYSTSTFKKENFLLQEQSEDQGSTDAKEVRVQDFLRFFRHPQEWYFEKVFSVRYDEEEVLVPETERFDAGNNLEKWKLKKDVFGTQEADQESYRQKAVKTGELPLGNMSKVTLRKIDQEVQDLREAFKANVKEQEPVEIPIDLKLGQTRMLGTIDGVYGNQLVKVSYSSEASKTRDGLLLFLSFVVLRAQGEAIEEAIFFYRDSKKNTSQWRFDGADLGQEQALAMLERYLGLFVNGREEVSAFNPKLVQTYQSRLKGKGTGRDTPLSNFQFALENSDGYSEAFRILLNEDFFEQFMTEQMEAFNALCEEFLGELNQRKIER